jgi:ESF2/ABP1 family protein
MATRKRNEYLEASESDEEDFGYDSEDESRERLLRGSKRAKISHNDIDDDEDDKEEVDNAQFDEEDGEEDIEDDEGSADSRSLAASIPHSILKQSQSTLLPSKPKKDKSGIIYLSRCPPFMKPSVLRSLLTPYGAVGRIFLTPEPTSQRTSRLKSGGSRRKLFLDGWVEFLKKKDAKFVAENLNAQTMGGKKRGRWHDEVWNIKYLSGVKWSTLTEQIQNENAERQARMRAEISQSKRENTRFLEDIERGKINKTMEERKKARGRTGDEDDNNGVEEVQEIGKRKKRPKLKFEQNEIRLKALKKPEPGQDVQRVLSSIF